jgi:hypothetical protein
MSNLLNKKSLYDMSKRGVEGNNVGDFTTPGSGFWDRDADTGNPTESPFSEKDHLKKLLDQKISSTRNGGDGTAYLSDVGGTVHPSAYRPLDYDLEGKPLYPNYDNNFGTPGANSTYENSFPDPDAKFN